MLSDALGSVKLSHKDVLVQFEYAEVLVRFEYAEGVG